MISIQSLQWYVEIFFKITVQSINYSSFSYNYHLSTTNKICLIDTPISCIFQSSPSDNKMSLLYNVCLCLSIQPKRVDAFWSNLVCKYILDVPRDIFWIDQNCKSMKTIYFPRIGLNDFGRFLLKSGPQRPEQNMLDNIFLKILVDTLNYRHSPIRWVI